MTNENDSPLKHREVEIQRSWFNALPRPEQTTIIKKAFEEKHSTRGKLDVKKIIETRKGLGYE